MLLEARNLTCVYHDGKENVTAVDRVNLALPEQGYFGIAGPSGSGKTSLLYLLAGIREATSGQVLYQGQAFPRGSSERNRLRRECMGFVFQFHFLINYLSVLQNILVGAHSSDRNKIEKAKALISTLGLAGLEKRPPYKLSGGQRQRVAIARALANDPQVVFVDEPTASLDRATGQKVVELLREVARTACVVVVTHDESILQGADGIFRMRDGVLTSETR